jgi:hypothetical protein
MSGNKTKPTTASVSGFTVLEQLVAASVAEVKQRYG